MSDLPKKYLWVLMASIALNGVLGGLHLSSKKHSAKPTSATSQERRINGRGLGQIINYIPEERRAEILKEIGDNRDEIRKKMLSIRAQSGDIDALAKAESLDIEDLRTALATYRQNRNALSTARDESILIILEKLTSEERQSAIEAMQADQAKRRTRRDKEHKKDNREGRQ